MQYAGRAKLVSQERSASTSRPVHAMYFERILKMLVNCDCLLGTCLLHFLFQGHRLSCVSLRSRLYVACKKVEKHDNDFQIQQAGFARAAC